MVVNLCEYAASFNYALLTGHKSFIVHPTRINREFTNYLLDNGYILGFSPRDKLLEIFPCHGVIHNVTSISSPSRSIFFGPHKIRHELNAGNRYVFLSSRGQILDSYQCVFANLGGQTLIFFSLFYGCFFGRIFFSQFGAFL